MAEELLVKLNHKTLINNGSFADVNIIIGKKIIYAHSYILTLRCPKLTDNSKKKKTIITKELPKETKENILLDVLTYVYSDEIAFSDLPVSDILIINAYAIEFDIPRLQWLCESHLREMLNTDNVYDVLIESHKAQQTRVKDFCFHFIVSHYESFIANKAKTAMLGIELFQDAISVNMQKETGQLKALDIKPCPPSTLVSDFKKLYTTMKDSIEATIFRVGVGGITQFVTAHRALLAGKTPQLAALCNSPQIKGPPEHIPVPLLKTKSVYDNISADSFETMLKYVYYGCADIPTINACELIPFTVDYQMAELQSICYKKLFSSVNVKTALPILGVTYIEQPESKHAIFTLDSVTIEATRKEAINCILSDWAGADLSLLPKMSPRIAVDLVLCNQRKERVAKGLPEEDESAKPKTDISARVYVSSSASSSSLKKEDKPKKEEKKEKKKKHEKKASTTAMKEEEGKKKKKKEDKKESKKEEKEEKIEEQREEKDTTDDALP